METNLSTKYSSLLDIEDVESLFEKLKEIYGSIRKAADKCGVARSTAYSWEKAKYVKSITRTKILKASLEENLIQTLGFVAGKSKERASDLLLTYLSSIYQEAIGKDRENFQNLLNQFLNARREHSGLIQDTLQDEVSEIMSILTERAKEYQIPLLPDPLDMIQSSYILEIMPDLIREIFVEGTSLGEIAKKHDIPLEVPLAFENAWNTIIFRFRTFAHRDVFEPYERLLFWKIGRYIPKWSAIGELLTSGVPAHITRAGMKDKYSTDNANSSEVQRLYNI